MPTLRTVFRSRSRSSLLGIAFVGAALVAEGCAGRLHPKAPAGSGSIVEASFTATAYCVGHLTAAGTVPVNGIVAADPTVLPTGTRIRLTGLARRYNGVYTVMDTGGSIRGRRIDLYMRDCSEARRFGRRSARVSIVH